MDRPCHASRPGFAFGYGYDSLDQLKSESNPAGQSWRYAYDRFGETTSQTAPHPAGADADLYRTDMGYDQAGQLTDVDRLVSRPGDDPQALHWGYGYDRDGNRTQTVQPGSPDQTTTDVKFDGRGLPWRTTVSGGTGIDAVSRTTITEYDANGALRRTVNPAGVSDGLPVAADDGTDDPSNLEAAAREATVRVRDADGLLTQERLPWRGASDNRYKRVWERATPQKWVTAIRMPSPIDADTAYKTSYQYNQAGWVTSRTDQEKSPVHDTDGADYDPLFTYGYDQAGHQTRWGSKHKGSDRGRSMDYIYWPNGLLRERSATKTVDDGAGGDADESVRSYEYLYNPNRSLAAVVDDDANPLRSGEQRRVTRYERDEAERETKVNEDWRAGSDVKLTYDTDTGDMTGRKTDGTFDGDTGPYGGDDEKNTTFEYDSMGRETKMTVDASRGDDRVTRTEWFPASTMRERAKSNGTVDTWHWNGLGEKTSHDRDPAADPIVTQNYDYDANGNRTTDERGTHEFNARDQLVKWTRPLGRGRDDRHGWVTTYDLNGSGAMQQKTETDPDDPSAHVTTMFDYDGERLQDTKTVDSAQVPGTDVTTRQFYRYDDAGNVQRIYRRVVSDLPVEDPPVDKTALDPANCEQADLTVSVRTTRYCYDEFNRQILASGSGVDDPGLVTYDGLDRRDRKQTKANASDPLVTRDYTYIGTSEQLASETKTTAGSEAVKRHSYDYDSQGDRQGQQTDTNQTGTTYKVYAKDANGSVTGLENDTGHVADDEHYDYDPYGELDLRPQAAHPGENDDPDPDSALSPDAQDNPFRFEGFYYDSGVKTYDMHARQYRPDTGRFLSRDQYATAAGDQALQSDPLTQNRYAYAGANPVTNIEFDGHRTGKKYLNHLNRTQIQNGGTSGSAGSSETPAVFNRIGRLVRQTPGYASSGGPSETQAAPATRPTVKFDSPEDRAQAYTMTYYACEGGCDADEFNGLLGQYADAENPSDVAFYDHGRQSAAFKTAFSAFTLAVTAADGIAAVRGAFAGIRACAKECGSLVQKALGRGGSKSTAAKVVRPTVSNPRLGRALGDDFRDVANPIGDGSALDAARHTVKTGDLIGGSTHLEKVVEMRNRYSRILRQGGLNPTDEAVARSRFDAYRGFADEYDLDSMMRARGLAK